MCNLCGMPPRGHPRGVLCPTSRSFRDRSEQPTDRPLGAQRLLHRPEWALTLIVTLHGQIDWPWVGFNLCKLMLIGQCFGQRPQEVREVFIPPGDCCPADPRLPFEIDRRLAITHACYRWLEFA